jgi:hypothetical protein
MPSEEWTNAEHVRRYFGRVDQYPRRAEGDSVLLEHVPRDARRILDLGTGDGRLLTLLRIDRPEMFDAPGRGRPDRPAIARLTSPVCVACSPSCWPYLRPPG